MPYEYDVSRKVLLDAHGVPVENEHRYTWTQELAQNKASYFPNLGNVLLTEGEDAACQLYPDSGKTKDLSDAYATAGINLTILVAPKNPALHRFHHRYGRT